MTPDIPLVSYETLKQLIDADIRKLESESEVKKTKRPPRKRRVACGCTERWVCPVHRGEAVEPFANARQTAGPRTESNGA